MLFWLIYDNRQSAYISHVYRSDKYGIVILYGLIAALNINRMAVIGILAVVKPSQSQPSKR